MRLPKLIVFDLDFTLWDCGGTWCDCLSPPFKLESRKVTDRNGKHIRFYRDVESILDFCDENEIAKGLASRTEQPTWARELLDLLGATQRFEFSEIYPSSKLRHFESLRVSSGIDYEQMLFFDDEMRNIREVSELGVTCVYVENGFYEDLFESGLAEFSEARSNE
ncbi:MAG: magnesium-dependent phosphatase-1 [Planctomycetota bacterium]